MLKFLLAAFLLICNGNGSVVTRNLGDTSPKKSVGFMEWKGLRDSEGSTYPICDSDLSWRDQANEISNYAQSCLDNSRGTSISYTNSTLGPKRNWEMQCERLTDGISAGGAGILVTRDAIRESFFKVQFLRDPSIRPSGFQVVVRLELKVQENMDVAALIKGSIVSIFVSKEGSTGLCPIYSFVVEMPSIEYARCSTVTAEPDEDDEYYSDELVQVFYIKALPQCS